MSVRTLRMAVAGFTWLCFGQSRSAALGHVLILRLTVEVPLSGFCALLAFTSSSLSSRSMLTLGAFLSFLEPALFAASATRPDGADTDLRIPPVLRPAEGGSSSPPRGPGVADERRVRRRLVCGRSAPQRMCVARACSMAYRRNFRDFIIPRWCSKLDRRGLARPPSTPLDGLLYLADDGL